MLNLVLGSLFTNSADLQPVCSIRVRLGIDYQVLQKPSHRFLSRYFGTEEQLPDCSVITLYRILTRPSHSALNLFGAMPSPGEMATESGSFGLASELSSNDLADSLVSASPVEKATRKDCALLHKHTI